MTSHAYKLEHADGHVEVVRVSAEPRRVVEFFGLCIALTCDGDAIACRREGGQIRTVIPSPAGSRTDRPLALDGPAANGGAA